MGYLKLGEKQTKMSENCTITHSIYKLLLFPDVRCHTSSCYCVRHHSWSDFTTGLQDKRHLQKRITADGLQSCRETSIRRRKWREVDGERDRNREREGQKKTSYFAHK